MPIRVPEGWPCATSPQALFLFKKTGGELDGGDFDCLSAGFL
jgi:hypothetical protein